MSIEAKFIGGPRDGETKERSHATPKQAFLINSGDETKHQPEQMHTYQLKHVRNGCATYEYIGIYNTLGERVT